MNAQELQQIREGLTELLSENPHLRLLIGQLGRLVSHLESEVDNRKQVMKMVQMHDRILMGDPEDEAKPGLIAKVNIMWKWKGWLLGCASAGFGSILTLIVKHFLQ